MKECELKVYTNDEREVFFAKGIYEWTTDSCVPNLYVRQEADEEDNQRLLRFFKKHNEMKVTIIIDEKGPYKTVCFDCFSKTPIISGASLSKDGYRKKYFADGYLEIFVSCALSSWKGDVKSLEDECFESVVVHYDNMEVWGRSLCYEEPISFVLNDGFSAELVRKRINSTNRAGVFQKKSLFLVKIMAHGKKSLNEFCRVIATFREFVCFATN